MDELLIKNYKSTLSVSPITGDDEICMDVNGNGHIYLSLNQVNDLISYLVSQLQEVGEPVEILTQK